MMSAKFKKMCEHYFGCSDFYQILKINPNASEKAIKKAYHKLSLLVHPDRVEEPEKEVATEKFKLLGRIYLVLQDKDKRQLYDDYGECDEENDLSFNWLGYWLSLFRKLEISDIKSYEKRYIGSMTERNDIKQAYVISRGNMDRILEMVPFSSWESEPRIISIVQEMVDRGEVKKYAAFFNESKKKKARRRRKLEKERREAESLSIKDVEKEIAKALRQRAKRFEKLWSSIKRNYCRTTGSRVNVNKRTKKKKKIKH